MANYQSVFKSLSDAKEQARAPGGLGDLDSVEWVDINISTTLISGETRFSEIFICIKIHTHIEAEFVRTARTTGP